MWYILPTENFDIHLFPVSSHHSSRNARKERLLTEDDQAHVCVSTTARQAAEKGYDVILPRDCIGDRDIPGASGEEVVKVGFSLLSMNTLDLHLTLLLAFALQDSGVKIPSTFPPSAASGPFSYSSCEKRYSVLQHGLRSLVFEPLTDHGFLVTQMVLHELADAFGTVVDSKDIN